MAELIFMIFGFHFVQWEEVKGIFLTGHLSKYILRFVFSRDRTEPTKSKINLDSFVLFFLNHNLENTFRRSMILSSQLE